MSVQKSCERLSKLVPVRNAVFGLDGSADGDEFSGVLAPLVVVDVESNADYPVGL
jgi:hypothetical protein